MPYGKIGYLEKLTAYKERPASDDLPGKFETGTGNFEGMAGVLGVRGYLEWVGDTFGRQYAEKYAGKYQGRALRLKQAMSAIRAYEYELSRTLLDILEETPGVTVYGLTDRTRLAERVPTVSFTLEGMHPRRVAEELDKAGIYVWDGNYYALAVTERLGRRRAARWCVGPVHNNTVEEIYRLGGVLNRIVGSRLLIYGHKRMSQR